ILVRLTFNFKLVDYHGYRPITIFMLTRTAQKRFAIAIVYFVGAPRLRERAFGERAFGREDSLPKRRVKESSFPKRRVREYSRRKAGFAIHHPVNPVRCNGSLLASLR
ncbi:hypothetical protein UH38_21450, partial [Aliterella atlantica CENA595]